MNRGIYTAMGLLALTGCAGPTLTDYSSATPALDIASYFEGQTKAWGQFQDCFGKVRRRFTVEIVGTRDGDGMLLVEDFVYDDGETEQRRWKLRRTGPGTWEGVADGVVGVATGTSAGNAFNWRYAFDLKTGENDTLRVHFDDWMWQQDDRVVINRAYVSKFGVNIGEVMIFFMKAPNAA